jgi:hypothetical protein
MRRRERGACHRGVEKAGSRQPLRGRRSSRRRQARQHVLRVNQGWPQRQLWVKAQLVLVITLIPPVPQPLELLGNPPSFFPFQVRAGGHDHRPRTGAGSQASLARSSARNRRRHSKRGSARYEAQPPGCRRCRPVAPEIGIVRHMLPVKCHVSLVDDRNRLTPGGSPRRGKALLQTVGSRGPCAR